MMEAIEFLVLRHIQRSARKMRKRIIKLLLVVVAISPVFSALNARAAFADEAGMYTVQAGDTLLKLAARFGVHVTELAAINDLEWNSWVYAGQKLSLPGATAGGQIEASQPAHRDLGLDPRMPAEFSALPVLAVQLSGPALVFTYARVIEDSALVYESPQAAVKGSTPKRTLGVGYIWVSVENHTSVDGQIVYQINPGEYVLADALSFYKPSEFQGVALANQPERPFAWILKPVQPSITPAGETNLGVPVYARYDLVQIFATEKVGDQVWYLIGPHQWINQTYVGKVETSPPPDGVGPDTRWVEVDLFEQTLAAYEGERMVYATLVSTGLRGWDTPPGLFQVWLNVRSRKMSGGYGRPDYYFLEDVPWTMYFNRDIALHTAYWHDGFGYRHSHGCVNLPPSDAKWLFEWAPDDTWVWVH
jgi:LysM repeat protein